MTELPIQGTSIDFVDKVNTITHSVSFNELIAHAVMLESIVCG